MQLTIENGRRPFTPPFAGLIRVSSNNKVPTAKAKNVPQVMSSVQLEELKKDLAKEEPVIPDNIVIQPATTKSKNSRN